MSHLLLLLAEPIRGGMCGEGKACGSDAAPGRGIFHSERTNEERRRTATRRQGAGARDGGGPVLDPGRGRTKTGQLMSQDRETGRGGFRCAEGAGPGGDETIGCPCCGGSLTPEMVSELMRKAGYTRPAPERLVARRRWRTAI